MPPEIYDHQPDHTLSIIVPVYNELDRLPELLAELRSVVCDQAIIVDGGSSDGSADYLREHWQNEILSRQVIEASTGRAKQMNAGAAVANGDVLLFLHADSSLPREVKKEISSALDRLYLWGRFDVCFRTPNSLNMRMKLTAYLINLRSRLTSIVTGDQGIFVARELFANVGGYRDLPLMEDVDLSQRLKKQGVPYSSTKKIVTSARRWEQAGWLKTVLFMWGYRLAFFFGVSAHKLAKHYRNIR